MTQLFFSVTCIVALFLLSQASKQDSRFYLCCGIGVLSFISGLRAPDVGIDSMFYYEAFVTDFAARPWQFKEVGFRASVMFLMDVFHSPEMVFLIVSILTNALIVLRLWDFRDKASFSFMSFLYISLFYIGTMNTMRQYLAVAILFFATRYLDRGKYAPFVPGLVLAASIHTTALMGVAFLFVYAWYNVKKDQRVYLGILAIVIIPIAVIAIATYELGHIENYFSGEIDNVNITFLYRVGVFAVACLLMRVSNDRRSLEANDNNIVDKRDSSTILCFIGLAASSAGMFFAYLGRLGYCFVMFEMVFWGKAVKREKWGWLYWLMPTVYALYSFGYELVFNGSGIFPFHFFFS